jgi:hypothetical protein
MSKLLDKTLETEFFHPCKRWIWSEVEYQSWRLWNSTHADQILETFDFCTKSYELFTQNCDAVWILKFP